MTLPLSQTDWIVIAVAVFFAVAIYQLHQGLEALSASVSDLHALMKWRLDHLEQHILEETRGVTEEIARRIGDLETRLETPHTWDGDSPFPYEP
jgi:hypothetical protein